MALSLGRKEEMLKLLGLDQKRLKRIKKSGVVVPTIREKSVILNSQRRSYCRHITKEVRVLKILRQMKKLTQDRGSIATTSTTSRVSHGGEVKVGEEVAEDFVLLRLAEWR